MDDKILKFRVGVMIPVNDGWFYRDSYNQVWKVTRGDDPYFPLRITLHEILNEPISPLESLVRKIK